MMHPVGPHGAQTYWIRRALVAVVAVALVVGAVWWALARTSGSGSGPDTLGAATTGTTAPQLTGVLATGLPTDATDDATAESEMQFREPDLAAADLAGAASGDPAAESSSSADSSAAAAASAVAGTSGAAAADDGAAGTTPDGDPDAAKATAAGTTATTAAGTTVAAKTTAAVSSATPTTGPVAPAPVTVTVTKVVTATPGAATTGSKTAVPTTTAPPKPSYDSAGRLLCPATSVSLSGVVWGTVAGQQPRLGLNVTNVGKQTCRQDVSGVKQIYTVFTAAGDRVWSTADCFPGEGTEVRTLGAGQKASFVIVWSGTTSEPGCTAPREKVKAGKYTLVVQLGDLKSKPLAFTMS